MTLTHNSNPNIVLISKLLAAPPRVYENALTQHDIQWIKDKEKYLQSSYTIEKQANVYM